MATTKSRAAAKPRPVAIADTTPPDLLDLYIEELSNEPVATAEAQKALARRMRNTKLSAEEREAARDELIRANLRFAFSVAKQYQNRGLPLEDLVGEANGGLCRAADKYDPDVGVNFISYAVWWIRQAIFSAISTKTHTVRVPLGRATDVRKIARARTALREVLEREPTIEELARVAELPLDVVRELSIAIQPERSLDVHREVLAPRGRLHVDQGPVRIVSGGRAGSWFRPQQRFFGRFCRGLRLDAARAAGLAGHNAAENHQAQN